jgi:cytochrome b6-f complex iron-sulfur subunit
MAKFPDFLKSKERMLPRRGFLLGAINLSWVVPLVAGLWGLAKYLRFEPPTTGGTQFPLGSSASLPDLPAYIENGQVWLHEDSSGYFAVDAICTHLGCIVRLQADTTYQCRCHGSRFTADGTVINGPATRPLRFLRLYWSGSGTLTVDRTSAVEASFRLPKT